MPALNERFGKYHILSRIAQGGMAEVYKVKTVGIAGFEKVQALKRMLPSLARQNRFIRSFIDEARIAVQLNHRNIVQVFDFGKVGSELFLSMELIDGIDLKNAIKRAAGQGERLSVPLACYIASEIGHGLDYAHNKRDTFGEPLDIVHCDVSPQNVMLSYEGYVKILDFGVARASIGTQEWTRRLRGKPRYMAPEQTRGDPPSFQTDVFALGIVAWEMLTGRPLFEGRDLASLLKAVRRADVPPVHSVNPAVPESASQAISKALSRERGDRGTAAELYMTLAHVAQMATPQGGARELARWLDKMQIRPTDVRAAVEPPPAEVAPANSAPSSRTPRPVPSVKTPRPAPTSKTPPPGQVSRNVVRRAAPTPAPATPPTSTSAPRDQKPRKFVRTVPRTVLDEARKKQQAQSDAEAGRPTGTRDAILAEAIAKAQAYMNSDAGRPTATQDAVTPDDHGRPTATQDAVTPDDHGRPTATQDAVMPDDHGRPTAAQDAVMPDDHGRSSAERAETAGLRGGGFEERVTMPLSTIEPSAFEAIATETYDRERVVGELSLDRELSDVSLPSVVVPEVRVPPEMRSITEPGLSSFGDEVTQASAGPDLEASADTPAFFSPQTTTVVIERDPRIEEIDEESDVVSAALREKRRVVVIAVLIEGGDDRPRQELLRLLSDMAYKRGAVLHEQHDDSLIAILGLEVAGDDDVAKAMGYALDSVECARELSVSSGGHLAMRFAARANVVASTARDLEGGYRLIGDAVAETRALAQSAEPGKPLLSGGEGRLTSAYYAFRELPTRRHRRRRLRVLELLGPRSFDERNRALHARVGRFVGRRSEVSQLSRALARTTESGRRHTVALVGPSGVGKSRLISEFVARTDVVPAGGTSPRVVAVAAMPGTGSSPFALVIDLLQAYLELPPERGEAARGRLSRRARHGLSRTSIPHEDIDEIVGALEVAMELRDGVMVTALHTSTDIRQRVLGALHSLYEAMRPQARSIVTIIEDIHLADSTSVELLRDSLDAFVERPELTILSTTTDNALAAELDQWVDETIHLGDLTGGEIDELITDRLADAATESRVIKIAQRARGNPLFIEQLANEARDVGEVPPTVRAVITARVDRLPASSKAVLQHAAIAGASFRAPILEELMGRDISDELGELCDDELLEHTSGGEAEGTMRFTADLTREVVYESLSANARRDTHRALGTLLSTRHRAGCDEPPVTIATHLEQGGMKPQASAYWLRAGRLALAAGDSKEAVERFARVLTIEKERPDETRSAASRNRKLGALLGREQANRMLGDHEAQRLDLDRLQEPARQDPSILADVNNRVALLGLRNGDLQAAVAASEEAEVAARSCLDERAMGEALRVRGEAFERLGEFERAMEITEQARAIFQRIGAIHEETKALVGIGRNHLFAARYEQAMAAYREIVGRVEDSGDPWLERVVRNHVSIIHWCLGEFEAAMASAKRSVDICRRYADRAREGDCLSVCGIILLDVGRYREARDYFTGALGILERTNSRWSRADCLSYAGSAEFALGDPGRGIGMLEEAESLAREIGAKYVRINALIAIAGAALERGQAGDSSWAGHSAGTAVELAREAKLIGAEILALSRLARALLQDGQVENARQWTDAAVALLDKQQYIEGPEQEIYYTRYLVARAAGDARAHTLLERARAEVERKLALIGDPDWREAFTTAVPINARILGH